jgi:hypothetical protein
LIFVGREKGTGYFWDKRNKGGLRTELGNKAKGKGGPLRIRKKGVKGKWVRCFEI